MPSVINFSGDDHWLPVVRISFRGCHPDFSFSRTPLSLFLLF